MKLKRSEKREIRKLVNKAIAARARTLNLTDVQSIAPELLSTPEAKEYAVAWRDAMAQSMEGVELFVEVKGEE
jgi:hypothetical protein